MAGGMIALARYVEAIRGVVKELVIVSEIGGMPEFCCYS